MSNPIIFVVTTTLSEKTPKRYNSGKYWKVIFKNDPKTTKIITRTRAKKLINKETQYTILKRVSPYIRHKLTEKKAYVKLDGFRNKALVDFF